MSKKKNIYKGQKPYFKDEYKKQSNEHLNKYVLLGSIIIKDDFYNILAKRQNEMVEIQKEIKELDKILGISPLVGYFSSLEGLLKIRDEKQFIIDRDEKLNSLLDEERKK